KLSYDPVADFVPVTLVVQYPSAMVVPNSSPAHSVTEFIAYAKANRGTVRFASPGHGTSPHLAGELFKRAAGIEMTTVPYRGAAPAIQDVIPGRVDVFFNNIAPLLSLMQQGQLRALAVTTAKRAPAAAELPTLAESGLTGFDVAGWYAFFVPSNTPPAIVRKIYADTAAALADPTIKGRLEQLGLFVIGSRPEDLEKFLSEERDKWGRVIKDPGISISEWGQGGATFRSKSGPGQSPPIDSAICSRCADSAAQPTWMAQGSACNRISAIASHSA